MTPDLGCFAHMLNLASQKAFQGALKEEVNTLNENDICNVEDIVKVMTPVKVVTTIMCEDEQPTISMISPLKAKLQKHFEASDDDTAIITEMKVFNNDFEKQYTHLHDLQTLRP
ncbi:hypothetical protein SKAU_G00094510 [Synaphobranchus kaupii]|uniref:Uncharacterized protein n=1 Tax=Synaphobranchus kaupii TaxID=118154 RepID=A0A9Q1J6U3_SYNKA|nr:hypothetical protein SKAU_G00094510 [Synaphobranchus kaupii]